MSARLRGIARQTEEIVETGHYPASDGRTVDIGRELAAALAGTRMYGPEAVEVVPDTDRTTSFEVTGESSTEAARRLTATDSGPVAVLNFASARNPGGGYLNGAQAQEEALCRASALYVTLLRAPSSTSTTAPSAAPSTPTGSSTHPASRSSATTGDGSSTSPAPWDF